VGDRPADAVTVHILDTLTGEVRRYEGPFNAHWWCEGNGGCDCNRDEAGVVVEPAARPAPPAPEPTFDEATTCAGCKRYLVVDAPDACDPAAGDFTLADYNGRYPPGLIGRHLGVFLRYARRRAEAELGRIISDLREDLAGRPPRP
jgi:hypothetical protein